MTSTGTRVIVEEGKRFVVVVAGRRLGGYGRQSRGPEGPAARRAGGPIAQRHLAVGPDLDTSFALLTEDLALEPLELLFEPGDFSACSA
jgi:hypothetical protein